MSEMHDKELTGTARDKQLAEATRDKELAGTARDKQLAERRRAIMERVEQACRKAGRELSEVSVQAVSKTVDVDAVIAARAAGFSSFGENRPQELVRKLELLATRGETPIRFDMIGNLQTNKINAVLGRAELIHSVSSLHLAQAISKRAQAREMVAKVLIEVNVSQEPSKSGFLVSEMDAALDEMMRMGGLSTLGLMTMAPAHDAERARATFSGLRELRDRLRRSHGLALDVLSCGMSDDYEIAVEEGSTLLRLGRVIFDRDYDIEPNEAERR